MQWLKCPKLDLALKNSLLLLVARLNGNNCSSYIRSIIIYCMVFNMINFSSFIFSVFSWLLVIVLGAISMLLFLFIVPSIPQYFLIFWNIKLELPFIDNYLFFIILLMLWAMHTLGILRLIIINEKADFFQLGNNSIKYNDYDRYSIKYKSNRIKYLSFGICIFLFLFIFWYLNILNMQVLKHINLIIIQCNLFSFLLELSI